MAPGETREAREAGEAYGCERAVAELAAIFEGQWANGMLPHIRFIDKQTGYRPGPEDWGVTPEIAGHARVGTSGITQPPIIASCALQVFQRLPDPPAYLADFLAFADGLERFHRFLLAERDPTGEGLVACFHPWETGTDNSPAFDGLLARTRAYLAEHGIAHLTFRRADTQAVAADQRPTDKDYSAYSGLMALFIRHKYDQGQIASEIPFLLQDVLFNCLLAESLEALAAMEEQLAGLIEARGEPAEDNETARPGELRAQAGRNREARQRLVAAIREHLWSEEDGLFYARDARQKVLIPVPTVSSLMPLLGGIATPAQAARLVEHLRDPEMYATPFPVASTAANYPGFDPRRYWAGPAWPVPNWLLSRALRDSEPGLAEHLRRRTLRMIAESDADPAGFVARAWQLMEANSVDGRATTPSRRLYRHAWLWDSAISAVGWTHVAAPPAATLDDAHGPLFWEYYHPMTGEPLGSPLMTWTAAVFLDLLAR